MKPYFLSQEGCEARKSLGDSLKLHLYPFERSIFPWSENDRESLLSFARLAKQDIESLIEILEVEPNEA